jgi:excisionase family DNA binding protein
MKQPTESAENSSAPRAARPGPRPGVRPVSLPSTVSEPLWDVRDVAAYLKLPISTIYKMTAKAAIIRIPHIHLGGALRFRRFDVDRWLAALTVSNIETLERTCTSVIKGIHGDHP